MTLPAGSSRSGPRVLVVDDEEGPREAIRMILKPLYDVHTAANGEEALAVLPELQPDIMFMDVKMPKMDGVQLLEHVKAADPQVEVVMITAYASLDTVQRAMRFGAMVENVVVDPETREVNYADDSITENTRAAYPLDFIANAVTSGTAGHPSHIIFLAADAFGILPPRAP